jgi:GNAT superfamily N-acetyltransferase
MTDDDLITYAEQTLTYPIRDYADGLEIRDWGHCQTKMDPSFASVDRNLLSMIRCEADAVDAMMDEIMRYYRGHGKEQICVITGPNTTPSGFTDYLLQEGATLKDRHFGMVFPVDRELEGEVDPRVIVREVDLKGTTDDITDMVDRAWGMPPGTCKQGVDELRKYDKGTVYEPRIFIAFHDGKPAAFSVMELYDDLPVIRIAGGATDPAFRGKGLYKAMVQARLDAARKLGKSHLVVQAIIDTSAPILKRMGFREICTLDKYEMAVRRTP